MKKEEIISYLSHSNISTSKFQIIKDILLNDEAELKIKTEKAKEIARLKHQQDIYRQSITDLNSQIDGRDKEIHRLRNQLAKGHHVECGCSFCQSPSFIYGESDEK